MSDVPWDDRSPNAIIPDRLGLTVVDVAALLSYLTEGQNLEDAIQNAGFDTIMVSPRATAEQWRAVVEDAFDRVCKLNETGDAAAYWDTEK